VRRSRRSYEICLYDIGLVILGELNGFFFMKSLLLPASVLLHLGLFVDFSFSLLHEYAYRVVLVGRKEKKKKIYQEDWRFGCLLMLCMEWLDE